MNPSSSGQIRLPPPLADYFAWDTADADAVVRCFREDAVVGSRSAL